MTDTPELDTEDQRWLLQLARAALMHMKPSGAAKPSLEEVLPGEIPAAVMQNWGAFTSLHKHGQLRGCIGYITADDPLYQTIIDTAISAARRDPRFDPVTLDEVPDLEIEISVMTPLRLIESVEEIEVGKHGLVVDQHGMRGLLLPQVATEHHWDRETFLNYTCRKAGLHREAWRDPDVHIYVFSAQVFSESSIGQAYT